MASFKNIFNTNRSLSKEDIRRYNNGEMKGKELYETERIMANCNLSNDAVEGFKEMGPDAINNVPDYNAFKKHLNARKGAKVSPLRPTINRMAAALLGVVVCVGAYMYWDHNASERLFANHFESYEDPKFFAMRDASSQTSDEINKKATEYYLAGDYDNAIEYLNAFLVKKPGDAQTLFLLGISHLENREAQKAIEHLSVVAGLDSPYKEEAKWRLALAQLKLKDIEGAKITLEDLQGNASAYYANKAIAVLKKL